MNSFKLQIFIVAISIAAFSSCKKDNPDNTKPKIDIVSEPLENDTLFTGSELHIEGSVSDNEELSQIKIDIHSAEDGHSHGKISAASFFEVIKIIDLKGRNRIFHEIIDIPQEAAAGKYDIIITAVDASGNQSDFVERDIFIRNSGDLVAPIIQVLSPTSNGNYTLGAALNINAQLADNIGLGDVEVKIYRGSNLVFDNDIELAEPTYTLNLVVPTTGWVAGEYTLEILVKDQVNNSIDTDITFNLN
jgi:hypothetical protein